MLNAPARRPRVSPAAPGIGRAWVTMAFLVGAALLAGAVILPPFAAGSLFPSRSLTSAPRATAQPSAPADSSPIVAETISAEPRAENPAATDTGDKPDGDVETRYSDLPLGAEPANEPPHRAAPETVPGAVPTSGTAASGTLTGGGLATGMFASRTALDTATAAEPSIELALRPIPPLGAAAAVAAEARPALSPPPARREPLPLQTDLLPAEVPGPRPVAKPGPERHG